MTDIGAVRVHGYTQKELEELEHKLEGDKLTRKAAKDAGVAMDNVTMRLANPAFKNAKEQFEKNPAFRLGFEAVEHAHRTDKSGTQLEDIKKGLESRDARYAHGGTTYIPA